MRTSVSRVQFRFLMDSWVARESELEKRPLKRTDIRKICRENRDPSRLYTYRHKEH